MSHLKYTGSSDFREFAKGDLFEKSKAVSFNRHEITEVDDASAEWLLENLPEEFEAVETSTEADDSGVESKATESSEEPKVSESTSTGTSAPSRGRGSTRTS